CPCCGYTTPVGSVRRQLKQRKGGATDARMFCVVTSQVNGQGRSYRTPNTPDEEVARNAAIRLQQVLSYGSPRLSSIPDENFTGLEPRRIPVPQYGMEGFADLFTPRQALFLTTLAKLCRQVGEKLALKSTNDLSDAVQACLSFVVSRQANTLTALSRWN